MALRRLQVTDFRCLQAAVLELDPRFTLISGPNASGKTSVLEAMYVLGRGRSFRTRRLESIIRSGSTRFVVFGEMETAERRISIGVEGGLTGIRAKIGGAATQTLAELAVTFPVQVIDPEVHKLIEEGPARRRRFLDWGVFHVEHDFMKTWQRYHLALRQRNAALKSRLARPLVVAWDGDLIRYGEELAAARSRYVASLQIHAGELARGLLGMELGLAHRSGWSRDIPLAEALERSWKLDQDRGSTQVGPQRAELVISVDGTPAKERVSRGQQKLLAAALLIAQIKLFPPDAPVQPSLLLDDPAAELDTSHLGELIQEVSGQANQLIVTTLQEDFSAFGTPGRRYRLDLGSLRSD